MKKYISLTLVLFMIVPLLLVVPMTASAATGEDLVRVAMNEVGNSDGTKYGTNGAWCAAFVSWCARQAGIPTSVIGNTINSSASDFGVPYYTWNDYYSGVYTPAVGDLLFFNWSSNTQLSLADHVGIIRENPYISGNYIVITSVEGNMSGRVRSDITRKVEISTGKICSWDSGYIIGFGKPNYENHTHSFWIEYESAHPHREYRKCNCGHTEYTGYTPNGFELKNETEHPHREYKKCYNCNYTEYTGNTVTLSTCSQCTAPGKPLLRDSLNGMSLEADGGILSYDPSISAICFSWDPTVNTTHYNLYIQKKSLKDDSYLEF